jgi:diguanylate cyclase (GGDEF)-like protein/PAS domain S-box-containing protein
MDIKKVMMLFHDVFEGVYLVDINRTILFWNHGAEQLTGYLGTEVIGKGCSGNLMMHVDCKGENLCAAGCPLTNTIRDGQAREVLLYLRHKQGHRVPVTVRSVPIKDDSGKIRFTMEFFVRSALAENTEHMKTLARKAFIDADTGLPNKEYMEGKLKSLLCSTADSESNFGVMFIKLDNLAQIADDYGFAAVNETLKVAARTIAENVESGDIVGKWLGGLLILVLTNSDRKSMMLNWANKIRALIQQSSVPGYEGLNIKICIGGIVTHTGEDIKLVLQTMEEQLKLSRNEHMSISIRD